MLRPWLKTLSSRQKSGLALFLVGFFFLTAALFLKGPQVFQQNTLSFSKTPEPINVVKEEDLPAKIAIAKVGVELPVFPAKVAEDNWEVSDKGASYLLGSGFPGREGNVVIYGHNKNSLLGPIRWLSKDGEIKIVNKKGEEFIYHVVETKTVSPETVAVLAPTQDATLTLYTCTGFLDRERFVVVAKLQGESEE